VGAASPSVDRRRRWTSVTGVLSSSLRVLVFAEVLAILPAIASPYLSTSSTTAATAFAPPSFWGVGQRGDVWPLDARPWDAVNARSTRLHSEAEAPRFAALPKCRTGAARLLMDAGEGRAASARKRNGAAGDKRSSKAAREAYLVDGLAELRKPTQPPPGGTPTQPAKPGYDWSLLGLDIGVAADAQAASDVSKAPPIPAPRDPAEPPELGAAGAAMPPPSGAATTLEAGGQDDGAGLGANAKDGVAREKGELSRLQQQLAEAQAEHRDLNELADQLSGRTGDEQGAALPFGAMHAREQLLALKKRKLLLKDRVQTLLRRVAEAEESVRRAEEDEGEEGVEDEGEARALAMMMESLEARGLRPEGVPPHKDSFFLALMLALQRAGLRPRGYDFREDSVMGAERQFPAAAKRARSDVLHLLAAQVHRLPGNRIGGWQLSEAEFTRYFSQAWWTVPAAVNDLLMASAHLYSVRIVALTISESGLTTDTYDPPAGAPRATIHLCRRGAHVISSSPIDPLDAAAFAAAFAAPGLAERAPPPTDGVLEFLPAPKIAPADAVGADGGKGVEQSRGLESLEAGLGLLDEVLVRGEEEEEEAHMAGDDSDVVEDSLDDEDEGGAAIDRLVNNMYTAAATRRVFVVVSIEPRARDQIMEVVSQLCRSFPLDVKVLDSLINWVRPERLHVTLQAMDVPIGETQEIGDALAETIEARALEAFTVRSGELGCFWRAAGSGWGRTPRVLWLGMEDARPLVELQQAIAAEFRARGVSPSTRPFCAHMTLGKTRGSERLSGSQRRALRTFGKWMQDPSRSMGLQKSLQDGARARNPLDATGRAGGSGRGARRLKSFLRRGVGHGARVSSKALTGETGLTGKQKQMANKEERKQGRDLGGLNAELAAELGWGDEEAEEGDDGGEAALQGPREGGRPAAITIRVEQLQVIVALPVEGSRHVVYRTLRTLRLPDAPDAPASVLSDGDC
jgi:2'-5' RNA ligase